MEVKLTRLTHKIAIQLHLVADVPFVVLAPGGQSGNFWIHRRITPGFSINNEPTWRSCKFLRWERLPELILFFQCKTMLVYLASCLMTVTN